MDIDISFNLCKTIMSYMKISCYCKVCADM